MVYGDLTMYNPYDMIEIILNGKSEYARPCEFDSDVVDHKNMKNAFGYYVKPTKAITTCNKCGQTVYVDLNLDDPPFAAVVARCVICNPEPIKPNNPFVNPLKVNAVGRVELDPLILDNRKAGEPATTTVAERQEKKKRTAKPKAASEFKETIKDEKEKPKEESIVPPVRSRELPTVDGISAEQSFDDNDLVEP
jgi:hypothetical protein